MTRPRPSQLLSSGLVAAMVATLLVLAVRADGNVVPELDLHDAGIWVVNRSEGLVGRTNTEIETVDTRLEVGSSSFDVVQSGATVVLHREDPARLVGLDPASGDFVDGPDLPDGTQFGLGGGTAAILDPVSGGLRVASATSSTVAVGLDPFGELSPVATFSESARLAVGDDGTVHVFDPEESELVSYSVDGVERARRSLDVDAGEDLQLTAVGTVPVVLAGGDVVTDRASILLEGTGDGPVLQEPGPAASSVLVATDDALLDVPLGGGEPRQLFAADSGGTAAPVLVAGCAYGAWSLHNRWAQVCAGQVRDGQVAEMPTGGELRYRVNRDRVTLNRLEDGSQLVFLDDTVTFLDGEWAEALVEEPDEDEQDDQEEETESTEQECAEEPAPPVAEDDRFGTRPGRPVVIRPLANDVDQNCDPLVIQQIEVEGDAGGARIDLVDDGRAVQVRLGTTKQIRFRYLVDDGNGAEVSASVVVQEVASGNEQPVLPEGGEETTVVTNGTVTHNVLASAYDPDGDVLSLRAVSVRGGDGNARPSPRGDVTFTAASVPGPVVVDYVVSDGEAEVTGRLTVDVVTGQQPPDARDDISSTIVGRTAEVDVLENDSDANDDPLTIVRAESDDDAQVQWDVESRLIRVTASRPGTVNVRYAVTDGQSTGEALLRVDIRDPVEQSAPVAVRDELRLTAGVPAYLPILNNDTDRDGDVLVVTGVEGLPNPSPISVSVVKRSVLKITAATPLIDELEFSYRVSDGGGVDIGTVLVEPAPTSQTNRPPIARVDEFTVRAGGIAVFPVLTNDTDPEGDPLTIMEPEPPRNPDVDGRLFLTGGELRYEAPRRPVNTIDLDYEVGDPSGNVTSGRIIVHVIGVDDRNRPPAPPDVIGRTLAGEQVVISVPVTKMDPDGDAVELLNGDVAPVRGSIVEVGPDQIVYRADESSSGTDEFTYRVRDRFGLEATGRVLVGIAEPPTTNSPPITEDDDAVIRPGDTVEIPVLANDEDPDGDPLMISDRPDDAPADGIGTISLTEDGQRIRYVAPPLEELDDVERTSFLYVADDGRGGTRAGKVTLLFRTDETNRPPVAVDDTIEAQEPGTVVRIDVVTDSDEDPDLDPLRVVETSLPGAEIMGPAGHVIELTMPDSPVQFTYAVSDGEASARAAVFIPVVVDEDLPPIAEPDRAEVASGGSVSVDVLDNDEDPEGERLHLLLTAGARHGRAEIVDGRVVFTAEQGYVGDAGFSYTVGDGPDPATANTAVASVVIDVSGASNTPPAFTSLPLEVPQDGERSVDLRRGVVDPDEGQTHTFTATPGSRGVDAELFGSELRVRVGADVAPGTVVPVELTVNDGEATAPGSVTVTVISSDRPPPTAAPDQADALQGQSVLIDVLANDTNPYPDQALEIVEIGQPSGEGNRVEPSGKGVQFTAGPDFFGTSTFPYRVNDRLGDPQREAEATVTVNVIGRPDKPAAPFCIGGEDRAVRIEWMAPNANGAPITRYLVRINEGASSTTREYGNATIQVIDGLTNGRDYTFQVGAVNEAVTDGNPEFSDPSPVCTPDQLPGQPDAPETTSGDGKLLITWKEPVNEGSAITAYRLTNTTTGEPKVVPASVTSFEWAGLENGTSYRFTVAAENGLGYGPASGLSTGDSIPAGLPFTPAAPEVRQEIGNRDGFLDVHWQWSTSQDNGDAASAFRITVFRNGSQVEQVQVNDGGARARTFNTVNGEEYQFTVEAMNKVGWSQPSARSAAAVSAAAPKAVSSVSADVESGVGSQQAKLTFTAPDDNGAAITGYQYSANGGAWTSFSGPASGTVSTLVSGLTNGTSYTFQVRAVNSDGEGAVGPASNAVKPYGVPTPPSVSASVSGQTINWTWSASNANGRTIVRYERSLDGGPWVNNGTSRSYSQSFGYAETHTLRVRAISDGTDGARNTSNAGQASGRTVDPPQPRITLRRGAAETSTEGYWYDVSLEQFPPSSSVTLHCHDSWDSSFWTETVTVDGAGNYRDSKLCYSADGNDHWVTGGGQESNHVQWCTSGKCR